MSYSVPSNTLYVRTQSDLPAPSAGVITLPENVVVQPEGQIDLDPGVRIVVPKTSVIVGRDAGIDGFVGSIDRPLIEGNGLIVRNVFLRNVGAIGAAYCIHTFTGFVDPRVSRIEGVTVGGTHGVLISSAQGVSIVQLLDTTDAEGIVFQGSNGGVQIDDHIPDEPACGGTGWHPV